MAEINAYPLQWPPGWPRATRREQSRFRTTLATARDELLRELHLLGARDVVLSSNAVLLKNGLPAARQGWIADPGAVAYFTRKGKSMAIPCDKWNLVEDNMRAISKTIEALRGIERWGAKQMVDAAFSGFAALPAGTSGEAWPDVMGLRDHTAPREVIEENYRALAKQHHPDAGGDPELWHAIQAAYEQAVAAKGGA